MKPQVRCAVAYIAACTVADSQATSIYDHERSLHVFLSGTISTSSIHVYDYTNQCAITGRGGRSGFDVFHHGERTHLSINISGNRFDGYESETSSHCSGTINGKTITLFDYSSGAHFLYTL